MVFNTHESAILDQISFQEMFHRLSFPEQLVLLSLSEDLTRPQIAQRLHMSPRSLSRLLRHLKAKLTQILAL